MLVDENKGIDSFREGCQSRTSLLQDKSNKIFDLEERGMLVGENKGIESLREGCQSRARLIQNKKNVSQILRTIKN